MRPAIALGLLLSISILGAPAQLQAGHADDVRSEAPQLLSFDELVTLSSTAKPDGQLGARLDNLLTTPFVNNDATAAGIEPHRPSVEKLGPVLRVASWNIERGLNFELIRAALTDTNEFERIAWNRSRVSAARRELIESQLSDLQNADVIVLNEADWGMKRTAYRDITRELSAALHMNYAFGVEFVEVDPVFALGTEQVHLPGAEQDARLQEDLRVNHEQYRGLHGTAI